MENKYINDLHKEHSEWTKELEFTKDEIKSFKNRLSEVVSANSKTEILAQVEHFQNQFIRHEELIDTFKHDINEDEARIADNVKANNVAIEHRKMEQNEKLAEGMNDFSRIYNDLKNEFNTFLSNVL